MTTMRRWLDAFCAGVAGLCFGLLVLAGLGFAIWRLGPWFRNLLP